MNVLHTLRCMGVTTLARVAEAAGLGESDVQSELIDLAVAGLVTYEPGDFGGWGVTPAGKTADAAGVAAELDAAGTKAGVAGALGRFLPLNTELLDLCEAWHLRSGTMNDHGDPGYDARVIALLADLDRRAGVVLAALTDALPRFGRYRVRLTEALRRVEAGETRFFTDDMASYHVIWFQLHEDLLVTLGIPR
ncbi:transcriptional regulator [Herbidospora cretacea]|uniref:transcriptional regulator n=1 Tax=Herbidospora cretacea TaxID=28444 RepID=UPI000AA32041|nr:transcriptional regulator [Herbidospora cretacea]